jgi:hypothetical protein
MQDTFETFNININNLIYFARNYKLLNDINTNFNALKLPAVTIKKTLNYTNSKNVLIFKKNNLINKNNHKLNYFLYEQNFKASYVLL